MSERDERRQLAVGAGLSPADPGVSEGADARDGPGLADASVAPDVADVSADRMDDVVQAVADLVEDLVEGTDTDDEGAPPPG